MIRYARYIITACMLSLVTLLAAQTVKIQTQHKVKKSETRYGIAKQYGITIDQLEAANPEMRMPGYELKKGDYINIPVRADAPAEANTPAATSTQAAPTTTPLTTAQAKKVKVGVMLPLHDKDGDGRRMVEYYRGLLLACDRVSKDGITVDMHAWNVEKGADVNKTLQEPDAANCDIIIGPLYSEQVKPIAEFCHAHGIRQVIPFSIDGQPTTLYDCVWQVYQSNAEIDAVAANRFLERFATYHPVIIDCGDPNSTKAPFTAALRSELDKKGVRYSLTSLNSSDNDFAKAFDLSRPNIVVLNTEHSPKLNDTFAKLNILTMANKNLNVSILGYTEWLMYTKVYQDLFFKYDAYIPTYFFYNETSRDTKWVENNYRQRFNLEMDANGLPRYALSGFDHGCFFIGGVAQFGSRFTGARGQMAYKSVQTPMHFSRQGKGMRNKNFMFVHYLPARTIESISY